MCSVVTSGVVRETECLPDGDGLNDRSPYEHPFMSVSWFWLLVRVGVEGFVAVR